jgi:hypothetical protein
MRVRKGGQKNTHVFVRQNAYTFGNAAIGKSGLNENLDKRAF